MQKNLRANQFAIFFFIIYCVLVVIQDDLVRVIDEVVLRGNSGLLKCLLPSYVADFVSIVAWIDDQGGVINANSDFGNESVAGEIYFCEQLPVLNISITVLTEQMMNHAILFSFRMRTEKKWIVHLCDLQFLFCNLICFLAH